MQNHFVMHHGSARRIARIAVHLEELVVDPHADNDVGELDVLHASPLEAVLYGLDLMFQDVIDDLDVLCFYAFMLLYFYAFMILCFYAFMLLCMVYYQFHS